MIEQSLRLDRDGSIMKIHSYYLLNGLNNSFKFCISLIINLDLNGVSLKSRLQEGKIVISLELKTK